MENLDDKRTDGEKLVSLCEPRMKPCRVQQIPFESLDRAAECSKVSYAGEFKVGRLPLSPQPRYAK